MPESGEWKRVPEFGVKRRGGPVASEILYRISEAYGRKPPRIHSYGISIQNTRGLRILEQQNQNSSASVRTGMVPDGPARPGAGGPRVRKNASCSVREPLLTECARGMRGYTYRSMYRECGPGRRAHTVLCTGSAAQVGAHTVVLLLTTIARTSTCNVQDLALQCILEEY